MGSTVVKGNILCKWKLNCTYFLDIYIIYSCDNNNNPDNISQLSEPNGWNNELIKTRIGRFIDCDLHCLLRVVKSKRYVHLSRHLKNKIITSSKIGNEIK